MPASPPAQAKARPGSARRATGNRRGPSPDAQVVIVSYPKTGRTWLRAMIGKALVAHFGLPESRMLDIDWLTRQAGLPVTQLTHDGAGVFGQLPYRELNRDKSAYAAVRVLLLGRDIRDTLVSSYFQALHRVGVYDGPLSAFVRDERFGADKILTFYRHWHDARATPRSLDFMRYEDMHADAPAALRRALAIMGAGAVGDEAIATAVHYAHFDNLRKVETEQRFDPAILSTPADAAAESFKVRKGVVGGFRDYLSQDDIDHVDRRVGELGCEFTRTATPQPVVPASRTMASP